MRNNFIEVLMVCKLLVMIEREGLYIFLDIMDFIISKFLMFKVM